MASRFVALGLAASLLLKIGNAWYYHGFPYADSVEIHTMTFSALQGRDLGVWNLRAAFYPMAFIYPPQRLLWTAGVRDPGLLVFAGRLVVVAFSLLNLWLVYRIGRRLFSPPVALIAFVLLAVSHLHVRLGSTALPRTVASSFLLASFWILLSRRGAGWGTLAGVALGAGGALRFGESVFVVPFALHLIWERRFRDLVAGLFGAFAGAAAVLGPGDLLYWPEMFWSLRHFIDFSFVKGLSSSGYEPIWEYLFIAPAASDFVTIGLFLYSLRFRPWRPALWCLAPVLLLSLFQHKEDRFLLPALPFFVLCAARGAWGVLESCCGSMAGLRHVVTSTALAGAVLLEIEGFRLRGSRDAVEVFRALAQDSQATDVMIERGVDAGARLYLRDGITVWTLHSERLREGAYLWGALRRPAAQYVVLRSATSREQAVRRLLKAAGFRRTELGAARYRDFTVFRRKARRIGKRLAAAPVRDS